RPALVGNRWTYPRRSGPARRGVHGGSGTKQPGGALSGSGEPSGPGHRSVRTHRQGQLSTPSDAAVKNEGTAMTKVRTCPTCADRIAVGDSYCEGCGRTLPGDARKAPAGPDEVPTAPQESLVGVVSGDDEGGKFPEKETREEPPRNGNEQRPQDCTGRSAPSKGSEAVHSGDTPLTERLASTPNGTRSMSWPPSQYVVMPSSRR